MEPAGNNNDERRLVMFIGPQKTGSTSLQAFLSKYAYRGSKNWERAFEGWEYPMFFGHRDGVKQIFVSKDKSQKLEKVRNKLMNSPSNLNLVVASEYLNVYGTLQHEESGKAILEMLSGWASVRIPEIVIHYRSPRLAHLVSVWKQLAFGYVNRKQPFHKSTFHQFMCSKTSEERVLSRLKGPLDPIQLAQTIVHYYQFPVYFVDMAGVAEQKLDVSHVFACSIMKVNCTDGNGWVKGLKSSKAIRANTKDYDPDLSPDQKDQMEQVFHQHDCAYGTELYENPLFRTVYPMSESWPKDCATVESIPLYMQNKSAMLHEFRRILQCPGYESVAAIYEGTKQEEEKLTQDVKLAKQLVKPEKIEVALYLTVALVAVILWRRKLHSRRRDDDDKRRWTSMTKKKLRSI